MRDSILRHQVREYEASVIRATLESQKWNRRATARYLGIGHRTLLYKLRAYGIKQIKQEEKAESVQT